MNKKAKKGKILKNRGGGEVTGLLSYRRTKTYAGCVMCCSYWVVQSIYRIVHTALMTGKNIGQTDRQKDTIATHYAYCHGQKDL